MALSNSMHYDANAGGMVYDDPSAATAGQAKAYPPGSLQMIPQADGSYQAINPRTGQAEVVYNDNDTSQMYFPSDGQVPASAQPAGAPTYHSDTGFGTLDEFLSRVIPGALAAIPAAASLAAPAAAAAGGSADSAATGGAAAAGGGGDATLQSILDSAAPAGESFTGPATGTVLEPGLQASGALVTPVEATPTLAELGATDLTPLAAAGAGAAAGATAGAASGGGGAGALETGAAGAGGAAAATEVAKQADGSPPPIADVPPIPVPDLSPTDLQKILDASGGGGVGDLLKLLGGGSDLAKLLGTGALTAGSIAADKYRTDAMTNLADKYTALGAPSRDRYEASFSPGFDVNSIPGFTNALNTSRDAVLRKFSTSGDPFGNPGQLTEAMNYLSGNLALPALQNYRNQNAATGGFGAFSTAAPGLASGAIDSNSSAYSDLGRGVSDIFNPPSDLATILKKFQSGSGSVI